MISPQKPFCPVDRDINSAAKGPFQQKKVLYLRQTRISLWLDQRIHIRPKSLVYKDFFTSIYSFKQPHKHKKHCPHPTILPRMAPTPAHRNYPRTPRVKKGPHRVNMGAISIILGSPQGSRRGQEESRPRVTRTLSRPLGFLPSRRMGCVLRPTVENFTEQECSCTFFATLRLRYTYPLGQAKNKRPRLS